MPSKAYGWKMRKEIIVAIPPAMRHTKKNFNISSVMFFLLARYKTANAPGRTIAKAAALILDAIAIPSEKPKPILKRNNGCFRIDL